MPKYKYTFPSSLTFYCSIYFMENYMKNRQAIEGENHIHYVHPLQPYIFIFKKFYNLLLLDVVESLKISLFRRTILRR